MTYIDMPSHMRAVPVVIAIPAALLPAVIHAGEVSVIYRFDDPVVAEAGRGFPRISFPATIQSGRPACRTDCPTGDESEWLKSERIQ